MNCEETISQIQAYLDQSLPAAEADALADHLEACPDCRHELDAYVAVERLLLAEPLRAAPPGFADRVMARLQAPALAEHPLRPKRACLAAACAAAALVAAGAGLLRVEQLGAAGTVLARLGTFLEGLAAAAVRGLRASESTVWELPWVSFSAVTILGAGLLLALGLGALRLIVEPRVRTSPSRTNGQTNCTGSLT